MNTPTLETERLILRPFEVTEAKTVFKCWNWGKGYTTEAMKEILSFAKNKLQIKEIVGRYAKENPASGNVMRKLGFKHEKDIDYVCNDGLVHYMGEQCRLYI